MPAAVPAVPCMLCSQLDGAAGRHWVATLPAPYRLTYC